MIKCIAIDDEPVALDIISDYVKKVPFLSLSGTFRDAIQALDFIQKNKVDLIFLDINMPDFNGIQFLKSLQSKPPIIFTTAYSEFAVQSYELNAVDYLLKPIEFDRFITAVNKLRTSQNTSPKQAVTENAEAVNYVVLKSGTKLHKIKFADILYIEGSGNYLTFYTVNLKIMVLMNMTDALKLLPEAQFSRIHKSFIVALNHISIIEIHQVQIQDAKIPVGNYYRESFQKKIIG